jgi:hypothetical protein
MPALQLIHRPTRTRFQAEHFQETFSEAQTRNGETRMVGEFTTPLSIADA